MPQQEMLYNIAFFIGSVIAVTVAYFCKPAGKEQQNVAGVVDGVGVGFVSKEAEERKDALSLRKTVALESIATSLAVLAYWERHEMQETLEEGFSRIDDAMRKLDRVPG